jgi:hypothetical protein
MYAAHMTWKEELLRLRSETSTLRRTTARAVRSLAQYKDKAGRLEKENHTLREKIDSLRKEKEALQDSLEKVKQQRDTYRGMIFKPTHTRSTPVKTELDRKRGGQKGHTGHGRQRPDHIDKKQRVFFSQCPTCQTPLKRAGSADTHTVTDIPAPETIQPVVIQYEVERQWCSTCKKDVVAVPAGVIPHARLGIHLIVQLMIWKYGCRLPFSSVVSLFSSTYGINVSAGTLVTMLHRTRTWLGPVYDRILAAIRASPIKHADETSWSIAGAHGWVWEFLTPTDVYYTIEETRGKGVPEKILAGSRETDVLVRDGYAGYEKLPMKQQGCWSHPIRYTKDAARRDEASDGMQAFADTLLAFYTDLKAATETPFVMEERISIHQLFKRRLETLICPISISSDVAKIQTYLTNQKNELLTALLVPGVPLTNNFAEQMLRSMVITRKISGASQSRKGAQTHAVNMSVFQTIKLHNELLIPTLHRYILQGITGKN